MVENGRVPSSASSPRSYASSHQDPDMQRLDPATVLQIHRSLLQSHDQLWTNHREGHTVSIFLQPMAYILSASLLSIYRRLPWNLIVFIVRT